jgi:hypothetical protein
MFVLRLMIASGALWAAAGITAGALRTVDETAPLASAESAELVLAKTDRLPLLPAHAIADRWTVIANQVPSRPVPVARIDEPQTVGATVSARRHHHPDRVCGAHGRRHFTLTRHGRPWRSWRCRR